MPTITPTPDEARQLVSDALSFLTGSLSVALGPEHPTPQLARRMAGNVRGWTHTTRLREFLDQVDLEATPDTNATEPRPAAFDLEAMLDHLRSDDVASDTFATIAAACLLAAHSRGWDAGEFVCQIGAAAAAALHVNVESIGTGVDQLLSNRPGSWEASGLESLLNSTVGADCEQLSAHLDPLLARWTPPRRFTATYSPTGANDAIPDDVTHLREAWDEDQRHDTTWRRAQTPNGNGWIQDGQTNEDEDGNLVEHTPLTDEQLYAECDELFEVTTDDGVLVIA